MLMTVRRLSEADKQQIVELYRQPGETALTIAERYGVSNSTVGRVLKGSMSVEEYDALVLQKRSRAEAPLQGNLLDAIEPIVEKPVEKTTETKPSIIIAGQRRTRSRLAASSTDLEQPSDEPLEADFPRKIERPRLQADRSDAANLGGDEVARSSLNELNDKSQVPRQTFPASSEIAALMEGEDFAGEEEDDLDDLEEDLEDEDLEEDDDAVSMTALPSLDLQSLVKILPLTEADMPQVCYLVVDRAAELIVRPLREFGDLGQVPTGEIQAMTLPVFDNHRVAKRFSNTRTQRVIKVPDSGLFEKAAWHLRAKGITRLLVDGQIYAI
ncbi:MAG: helix-turn-helix domain-containing protein [Synechococcales bacterium]|nr:helix-turn-helix domain-containing protein [Synechococcales bacterium]